MLARDKLQSAKENASLGLIFRRADTSLRDNRKSSRSGDARSLNTRKDACECMTCYRLIFNHVTAVISGSEPCE